MRGNQPEQLPHCHCAAEAIRLSSAPMRGATCRRPTIQRDPDARQSHHQAVIRRRKAPGGTPGSLKSSREAALGQLLEAPWSASSQLQNTRTIQREASQADLRKPAEYRYSQSAIYRTPATAVYAAHSTRRMVKTWKTASFPTHHRMNTEGCPWLKVTKSSNGEQTTC